MKYRRTLLVEKKSDYLKHFFKEDKFWEQPEEYWDDPYYDWDDDSDYYDSLWKEASESGNIVEEIEKSESHGTFTWEDIAKSTKKTKSWKRNY